ncbi:MAG: Calcium-transporting ATPase [Actinobacteria bacterium ADurb.Bin444]|nr:MAG: Calcium-transporting ATPase [Actinobacteria bacterium ADurb.Bin444]
MLFTVLTLSQMFHVMAVRLDRESLFVAGPLSNPLLFGAVILTLLLQFALIYVPFLQDVFDTVALSVSHLLIAFALSSIIFWMIEMQKWLERRRETT